MTDRVKEAKELLAQVFQFEQVLREDIMDIQQREEESGVYSSLTMNDDLNGPPFVLSEDAAPDLDAAIGELEHVADYLQSAIDNIEEHVKYG